MTREEMTRRADEIGKLEGQLEEIEKILEEEIVRINLSYKDSSAVGTLAKDWAAPVVEFIRDHLMAKKHTLLARIIDLENPEAKIEGINVFKEPDNSFEAVFGASPREVGL